MLYGGNGNDFLYGGAGADIVHGDNGNDVISINADGSTVYGDAGDDILSMTAAYSTTLHGGADNDTYYLYDWGSSKTITVQDDSGTADTVDVGIASSIPILALTLTERTSVLTATLPKLSFRTSLALLPMAISCFRLRTSSIRMLFLLMSHPH